MEFDLARCREMLEDENALLLDIRTSKEFCKGHFDGAALVVTDHPPLNACQERNLALILHRMVGPNKNRSIVVYCKKGIRASLARDIIVQKLDFEDSRVAVAGGTTVEPLKSLIKKNDPLYWDIGCNGKRNVARRFIVD